MESFVAELEAAVQTIRFARDVGIQRGRVLVGDYILAKLQEHGNYEFWWANIVKEAKFHLQR